MTTDNNQLVIPPADRAWINARYMVCGMLDAQLAGEDHEAQDAVATAGISRLSVDAARYLCVNLASWAAGFEEPFGQIGRQHDGDFRWDLVSIPNDPDDNTWHKAYELVGEVLSAKLAGKDHEGQDVVAANAIKDLSADAVKALCVQLAGLVAGGLTRAACEKAGVESEDYKAARREIERTSADLSDWAFLDESKPGRLIAANEARRMTTTDEEPLTADEIELDFWRAASKLDPDQAVTAAITMGARAAMDLAGWHAEDSRRELIGAAVDVIAAAARRRSETLAATERPRN